jgi:hypothetical protein
MKAIKNLVLMSATLFLCLTVNASCKKGTTIEPIDLSNPQAAAAQAKAQAAIAGMVEIIYENAMKSGAVTGTTTPLSIGTCPVITYTPAGNGTGFPATLKIDFGTGCTTQSGVYAAGSLTMTVTGRLSQTGSQISGAFSNFKYGSLNLSGSLSLTMKAASPNAFQQIQVVGTSIGAQAGSTAVSFSSLDMLRTQTAGTGTQPSQGSNGTWLNDDVFETQISKAEGSATGEKINGTVSFSAKTTANLRKAYTCSYPDTGILEVTMGRVVAIVNFGAGTCDNKATVKVGNQAEEEIELPSRP